MSDYEVDKGVDVAHNGQGHANRRYPWRWMDVGDSFFVPMKGSRERDRLSEGIKYLRSSIYNSGRAALAAMGLTREAGYTVVVRKVTENDDY